MAIPPSYMNSYTKGELSPPKWPLKCVPCLGEKKVFLDSENGISIFFFLILGFVRGRQIRNPGTAAKK